MKRMIFLAGFVSLLWGSWAIHQHRATAGIWTCGFGIVLILVGCRRSSEAVNASSAVGINPSGVVTTTSDQGGPLPGTLAPDLIKSYNLTPNETAFFGRWLEGTLDGYRIAFIERGNSLQIFVGNFDSDQEQLTDIYLSRVSATSPHPKDNSPQRLDSFVGPEGALLASQYSLNATGPKEYPRLKIPAIRDGLPKLSSAVAEVGIFEQPGIQIFCQDASLSDVENNLRISLRIVRALEKT